MKKVILKCLIILFIFLIGCASYQSSPDRDDFDCTECFNASDCLYRNKLNKDKSVCLDDLKERRVKHRYEYCRDPANRPDNIDFEKCMYIRNQK